MSLNASVIFPTLFNNTPRNPLCPAPRIGILCTPTDANDGNYSGPPTPFPIL